MSTDFLSGIRLSSLIIKVANMSIFDFCSQNQRQRKSIKHQYKLSRLQNDKEYKGFLIFLLNLWPEKIVVRCSQEG